jgi:hypothetical protein
MIKGQSETREFNPRATTAGLSVESTSVLSFLKISSMQMKIKKHFTAMLRK